MTDLRQLTDAFGTLATATQTALAAVSARLALGFNVRDYGALGLDTVNEEAAFQAALTASLLAGGGAVEVPPGRYKINGSLVIGNSQALVGGDYNSSVLKPLTGLAVPLIALAGTEGPSLIGIGIERATNGGIAGVPAVSITGYQARISNCRIDHWAGRGIELGSSVHPSIRDTRVSYMGEDGIVGLPTIATLENVSSLHNGGHGYALGNGQITLVACSADNNGGDGFYITSGAVTLLNCYGESNTGHVVHVDGTIQWATSVTLAADAAQNASTLTVDALTKRLPRYSTLRFADGTAVMTGSTKYQPGATSIALSVKHSLARAQSSAAVATLAPEDINPGELPVVRIVGGRLDGNVYLHACNYELVGFLPIGGSITATPSSRMIGEASAVTALGRPRLWNGRGGSEATGAALGLSHPVVGTGLIHGIGPQTLYGLTVGGTSVLVQDTTSLAGWCAKLTASDSTCYLSEGWTFAGVPEGEYVIRVHAKNVAREANAISIRPNAYTSPNITTKFTAATTDWEWLSLDYSHTSVRRSAGGTVLVGHSGSTDVYVDAIVLVPKPTLVSTSGTVRSASGTTATRPSPLIEGPGARWYDTTLGKPIWSDGTAWRDASGATV